MSRDGGQDGHDLETTASLLARIKEGDSAAREDLCARFLPALSRWARGRLPRYARDLEDTDDLVQVSMLRALEKVGSFEPEHPGAFLAYLRTILTNAIRDRVRNSRRRGVEEPVTEALVANEASPLETAIGAEAIEAYEEALGELTEQQRAALMLRIELGFGWAEVADAVGSPSPDAARMLVARGVARLAERMRVEP